LVGSIGSTPNLGWENKSCFVIFATNIFQMRQITKLFYLFLLISHQLIAQNVIQGSIYLRTQQEVDQFSSTDAIVEGTVYIGSTDTSTYSDITHLDSLYHLKSVWNLGIFRNRNLKTLRGLQNLNYIEAYFVIQQNPSLKRIEGLDSLEFIYILVAHKNDSLENIGYFPSIKYGLYLDVTENANLVALTDFYLPDNYHLPVNNKINLYIDKNPRLEYVSLSKRRQRADAIKIKNNPRLRKIQLDSLIYVNRLEIEDNPSLDSLCPLVSLKKANTVRIAGTDSLKYINNLFPALDTLEGLYIFGNSNLISINEDYGPKHVSGIVIGDYNSGVVVKYLDNPKLRYITGFNRLKTTDDVYNEFLIRIHKNAIADTFLLLSGFNKLERGDLYFSKNGRYPDGSLDTTGHIGTIEGFRSMKTSNDGIYLGCPPNTGIHVIRGFDSLAHHEISLRFANIQDTLDAFQGLKTTRYCWLEASVSKNCWVSPRTFAQLEDMQQQSGVSNGASQLLFGNYAPFPGALPIKFPKLRKVDGVDLGTTDTILNNYFPVLEEIGSISSKNNKNLKHFSDFYALKKVTTDSIVIVGNDALIDCPAICNILKAQIGFARIDNALAPCSDRPTVTAWCDTITFIAEPPTERKALVYPNPIRSGSLLTVHVEQEISGEAHLSLHNTNGLCIVSLSKQIDSGEAISMQLPEMLPNGTYFLHLRSQSGSFAHKIIVLER
jgi:Secretion system C-terminal sorting domain